MSRFFFFFFCPEALYKLETSTGMRIFGDWQLVWSQQEVADINFQNVLCSTYTHCEHHRTEEWHVVRCQSLNLLLEEDWRSKHWQKTGGAICRGLTSDCLKFLVDKPRSKTWYIVIHLWLRYSFTSFNITTQNVIFSGRGVRPSCNIHQTEKFKFW